MPRELKKRGRREEKKRKAQDVLELDSTKKSRLDDDDENGQQSEPDFEVEVEGEAGDDFIGIGTESYPTDQPQMQNEFYGLLDEAEQSYYAGVNAKLNADDFESDEDRALFVQAVHRETKGKELKVASSQSCSRYIEKIILLSQPDQLRSLFTAFLENLTYLVQHRFGSHCCEALFLQSSNFVKTDRNADDEDANLEDLFVSAVEQLRPNMGYLITDRFATHSIRVLLLVLSGERVDESSRKVIASKRKEQSGLPKASEISSAGKIALPKSFGKARDDLITAAFTGLDTTYVRALATHPTGNPFLQLVLRLELGMHGRSKDKPNQLLFPNLFPDGDFQVESETGRFIQGLMYDPTGSHLVETLVQYLPGKQFKKLYANILKERMRNLAKNDIASYIAIRVLERLGKDDLADARDLIMPEIPNLIHRSRLGLIKTLFDRFAVRQVDSQPLVQAVLDAYEVSTAELVPRIFQANQLVDVPKAESNINAAASEKVDLHGSLFVQSMLADPQACKVVQQSFLAQPTSSLLSMATNNIASRAVQVALTSEQSSLQFRKQMVPKFYGIVAELATTAAGSHVVDVLWGATNGAHFMKEKIARELSQHETFLRESMYGRTVWRNWAMDSYQRRPGEWHALAKSSSVGTNSPQPQVRPEAEQSPDTKAKSAIQLARERHAKTKDREQRSIHPMRKAMLASS